MGFHISGPSFASVCALCDRPGYLSRTGTNNPCGRAESYLYCMLFESNCQENCADATCKKATCQKDLLFFHEDERIIKSKLRWPSSEAILMCCVKNGSDESGLLRKPEKRRRLDGCASRQVNSGMLELVQKTAGKEGKNGKNENEGGDASRQQYGGDEGV